MSACFRSLGWAAAALALAAGAARAESFDRADWQADYAYLKHRLEALDANLAWLGSPESGVDLPALDRRTSETLARAASEEDAHQALKDFTAGLHDGHFAELTTLAPSPGGKPAEPPKPELRPEDPAAGCAALGYGSTARVPFSLPFESLKGFRMEGDGMSSVFRAGVIEDGRGGRLGIVRIQNFRATPFAAVCPLAWQALVKAGRPIDPDALADAANDAWLDALAGQLRRFRAEDVRAVIVDVGADSGGNDLGDYAPRLFTDRTVQSARLRMVAAAPAAAYLDEVIGGLTKGLAEAKTEAGRKALQAALADFQARKAGVGRARCDLSWVWRERRPWRPDACNNLVDAGGSTGPSRGLERGAFGDPAAAARLSGASQFERDWGAWTGPAYVLTSATSYSSAEMFSAVMQDNRIARTIGVKTGGDGCGFMTEAEPVTLPHSRLRYRIPNCVRLRADGTDEVAGIRPDLPIEPYEGESDRARAQRVVDTVFRDVGG